MKIKMNEVEKLVRNQDFYRPEQFCSDAKRYIKAIKEGRVIVSIESVSSSGMSRVMKYLECHKHKGSSRYQYFNFFAFFRALGWSPAGKYKDGFRIGGCGMNMVFHVNYTNIHQLQRLGFLTRKQCDKLAQCTPDII